VSIDRFHAMIASSHFHTQDWRRLSATEQTIAERFVHEHWHRSLSERSVLIDRLFTDDPAKPRRWSIVVQLLASFNTSEIPPPEKPCESCGTPTSNRVQEVMDDPYGIACSEPELGVPLTMTVDHVVCPKCVCPACGTTTEGGVCQPCFEEVGFGHGGHE
jgi:hypothetical protein